ncbi:hypothetical protein Anas_03302 [Armadillidium nasatum]|uniref:Spondin domain-containing protein n=1 Tax=Armadillidium nasatum TaxID=96803 RepID=A0A5N5T2I4_9CRUS|nr:hypothetical protein Anas_03302 [Armadillidium nasatum]
MSEWNSDWTQCSVTCGTGWTEIKRMVKVLLKYLHNWKYSYLHSFSPTEKNIYKNEIKKVENRWKDNDGTEVEPQNGGKPCPRKTVRRRKCKLPKCIYYIDVIYLFIKLMG